MAPERSPSIRTPTMPNHGMECVPRPTTVLMMMRLPKAPAMKTSLCAKLISCSTPYTSVYPRAMSAYIEPRDTPATRKFRKSVMPVSSPSAVGHACCTGPRRGALQPSAAGPSPEISLSCLWSLRLGDVSEADDVAVLVLEQVDRSRPGGQVAVGTERDVPGDAVVVRLVHRVVDRRSADCPALRGLLDRGQQDVGRVVGLRGVGSRVGLELGLVVRGELLRRRGHGGVLAAAAEVPAVACATGAALEDRV